MNEERRTKERARGEAEEEQMMIKIFSTKEVDSIVSRAQRLLLALLLFLVRLLLVLLLLVVVVMTMI